jgi:spermidine/putrescine transport system permease protein
MKTLRSLLALTSVLAATALTPAAESGGELNLFGWSEYIPQAVLDGFTKETGIKVNFETYGSNEQMISKLVAGAGAYDLVQPSDYTAEEMIKQGMLAPLDPALLPNLKNLAPEFRHRVHDPEDKYTVPYMSGTVGIVVNTEKIKTPVKGYRDVFTAANKGRIVALDDSREHLTWALYTLGRPINTITTEVLAQARPLMLERMKLVKLFDSDSPKTALLNGDVDIGIVWCGEAAILWKENQKFQYVIPAEGAHQFLDTLCIPTTAKNKENAHKFMNYILSDAFPYTNPNAEARKLLSAEQLANPASYPAPAKLETFRALGKEKTEIENLYNDLKNSL